MQKTSKFGGEVTIDNYEEVLTLRRTAPSGVLVDSVENLERRFYKVIAYSSWIQTLSEKGLCIGEVDNKLAIKDRLKSKMVKSIFGVSSLIIFIFSAGEILSGLGVDKGVLAQYGAYVRTGAITFSIILFLTIHLKGKQNAKTELLSELRTITEGCERLSKRLEGHAEFQERLECISISANYIIERS